MWLKHCLFICAAAGAVKIDMLGSINLGKDVAEVLTGYFKDDMINMDQTGRRAMDNDFQEIQATIKRMRICKGLSFCTDQMETFLIEYILALTHVVKSAFDGVLDDELCIIKSILKSVKQVKKLVKSTTGLDEVHTWTEVLKKSSATFLEKSLELIELGVDKVERKKQATTILRQQLVVSIAKVEKEYQTKLCREFGTCPYQYDISIHLQHLLNLIKATNDTKVRIFLDEFKNIYLRVPLFKELDAATMKSFREVVSEMTILDSLGKKVILSITDAVQKRLSQSGPIGDDELVLQAILADMDHLYVNNADEPVEGFMDVLKRWLKTDDRGSLKSGMESLYGGLASLLYNRPPELVSKLKTEVEVLLELTVGQ